MSIKYNVEMKNLHFKDTLKNFLFDLDDFITIYDDSLHVFNYQKLNKLSDSEIILSLDKRKIIINGDNLKIKQMTKQELLINGKIMKVEFKYD